MNYGLSVMAQMAASHAANGALQSSAKHKSNKDNVVANDWEISTVLSICITPHYHVSSLIESQFPFNTIERATTR